jgi:hypothetical protein
MDESADGRPRTRILKLKRETVRDLGPHLLSSQGHSLWTCDASARDDTQAAGLRRRPRPPSDE